MPYGNEKATSNLKRLLSVEEAASYMGRTTDAFRQLIHRGKVPVVRIDRRVQVDRQDLDRLIEGNKVKETE